MQRNLVYSDTNKVIAMLSNVKKRQLPVTKILELLNAQETESLWDIARLTKAIEYSKQKKSKYAGLSLTPGGKSVRYSHGERSGINTGLYRDVVEALKADGIKIDQIFSGLHRTAYDVHNLGPQNGHWSRPDLLLELRTRPNLSKPKELHSFEIESEGGALAVNVAQAYVSGRGATKSWLLFSLEDYGTTRKSRDENLVWVATEQFARELGVGLVGYHNISAVSTWKVIVPPKRRRPDKDGLAALKALILKAQQGM